jgi:hypothetical protein
MSETICMKAPDELADRIQEEADENDISTSACLRRLTRQGLDAQESTANLTLPDIGLWLGTALLGAFVLDPTRTGAVAGGVLIVASLIAGREDVYARFQSLTGGDSATKSEVDTD